MKTRLSPVLNISMITLVLLSCTISSVNSPSENYGDGTAQPPDATSSFTKSPPANFPSSDFQILPVPSNDNILFFRTEMDNILSFGLSIGIYSGSTKKQGQTCLTCDISLDKHSGSSSHLLPPSLSPDNNTLATTGIISDENNSVLSKGLWLIDLKSGDVFISDIEEYGGFRNPSWSPDGNQIAYRTGDGTIKILDIVSQKLIFSERTVPSAQVDTYLSWSPDGTQLLYDSTSNYIVKINIDERTTAILQPKIDNYSHVISYPVWSPTGKEILFASNMEERLTGITYKELYYEKDISSGGNLQIVAVDLFIMSVDSGEQKCTTCDLDNSPSWSLLPTWSPDGNQIAFFGYDFSQLPESFFSLYIYDLQRKSIKNIAKFSQLPFDLAPLLRGGGPPQWSSRGDQLVFSAPNNDDYSVYVINSDGSGLKLLASETGKDFVFPLWTEGH